MESIKEIENKLLSIVKEYDISKYCFSDVLKTIQDRVLKELVTKYNIYEIKKYNLPKGIKNEDLTFKKVEEIIKEHFKQFSKENKIYEALPYPHIEKMFNHQKIKYFSVWDYQKSFNRDNEKIKEDIIKTIDNLKEICFNIGGLTDRYYKAERLRDLNDFLKWAYNISLNVKNYGDWYDMPYKDFEKKINELDKNIKLRMFDNWFYLSFKDDERQNDLKRRVKELIIKRLSHKE